VLIDEESDHDLSFDCFLKVWTWTKVGFPILCTTAGQEVIELVGRQALQLHPTLGEEVMEVLASVSELFAWSTGQPRR
jgi:hypothetical protein